jgi:diadenosine tetraphosphate (Ap4A) HIT family hydrolase
VVAPRRHVESWVCDLDEAQFLAFQRVVYRVARALAAAVPTERMYALSLGSQQGNAHLHWRLAPLPPGVPYHQQQLSALSAERGVLDVDDDSQAALARAIRSHLSPGTLSPVNRLRISLRVRGIRSSRWWPWPGGVAARTGSSCR